MVRIRLILPRVVRSGGVRLGAGPAAYDLCMTTAPAPLPLLVLGQGTGCTPSAAWRSRRPARPIGPRPVERARAAKAALGDQVFVLGHHYQRDEVIQFADVTGDSFARP